MDHFEFCAGFLKTGEGDDKRPQTSAIYVDGNGTMYAANKHQIVICEGTGFPEGIYSPDGSEYHEGPVHPDILLHTGPLFSEDAIPFDAYRPIILGEDVIFIGCDLPFKKHLIESTIGPITHDQDLVMFFRLHKSSGAVTSAKAYIIADHGYSIVLSYSDSE